METNTLRFILLGDTQTGKTTFFYKFKNDYNEPLTPTIGVDVHTYKHKIYNYNSKIIIWDTSGEQRFRNIVDSYIPNNCGYILFFDLHNNESFLSLENWIQHIQKRNV